MRMLALLAGGGASLPGGHGAKANDGFRLAGNFRRNSRPDSGAGRQVQIPARDHLNWYYDSVKLVETAPLGKQRSRDPKDDPYLAWALGAGAKFIVSRDDDLPAWGKPFGIHILPPREPLIKLARPL